MTVRRRLSPPGSRLQVGGRKEAADGEQGKGLFCYPSETGVAWLPRDRRARQLLGGP